MISPMRIAGCACAAKADASAATAMMSLILGSPSEGSRTIPKEEPTVRRSAERILTTHVGSLPRTEGDTVESVVRRQRSLGLDLINEGEYTKGGDWLSYVEDRFGGFEPRPPQADAVALIA